jgi:hypothetical protein
MDKEVKSFPSFQDSAIYDNDYEHGFLKVIVFNHKQADDAFKFMIKRWAGEFMMMCVYGSKCKYVTNLFDAMYFFRECEDESKA